MISRWLRRGHGSPSSVSMVIHVVYLSPAAWAENKTSSCMFHFMFILPMMERSLHSHRRGLPNGRVQGVKAHYHDYLPTVSDTHGDRHQDRGRQASPAA
ncbi:hypothetical protein F5Y15DRAFT_385293 [Xylariaceae sp. FL0016]|nr:hypothetical protein F5Y15DRAFT_385293 [Xylariaceae sp. FL0016]